MTNQEEQIHINQETRGQTVKNSGVISAFNALGFASALLIDILVATRFGLSRETDAFFIAYTLPQLIASILLVSFNVVLVPIFSNLILDEGKNGLWRVISNLINISFAFFGILGIVGILSSPLLINIQGAGLNIDTRNLAVSLNRLIFAMIIPLGAIEILKATLNSLRDFAFPAAMTFVQNAGTFTILLFFNQRLGIHALALGYVIASWMQLLILWIVLFLKGYRPKPIFDWHEPYTTEALKQIRLPLAGSIIGQSNIMLERFLASFLPTGLVSALGYARRILHAVDRVFFGGISIAFLPRLSFQFAQKNLDSFKQSLSLALRLALFISLPISAGIIGLRVLIVDLLFGRGAFDIDATMTTAKLVSIFILSIPSVALYQVLRIAFFAFKDTKTPFYNRVLLLAVNLILDITFFLIIGANGLALALTIARTLGVVHIAVLLYRKYKFVNADLILTSVKISIASIVAGIVVYIYQGEVLNNLPGLLYHSVQEAVYLAIGIIIGAGVFISLILLLRVKEINQVIKIIKLRFMPGMEKQP